MQDTAMPLQLYGMLYDLVNLHLRQAGIPAGLDISRTGFLYSVQQTHGVADVSKMLHVSDPSEFLEIAYLGLLCHLPDPAERERWKKKETLPVEEYQRQVVCCLTGSAEFAGKNVRVIGSPWKIGRSVRQRLLQTARRFYNRLPAGTRKAAKTLYHRVTGRR